MDDFFPAVGGSIDEAARASLTEALANMAVLKNVPLSPEELDEAAGLLFTQMDWAQVHDLTGLDGLAARGWAVNGHLDMIAVARLKGIITCIEGKNDIDDAVVTAVALEIVSKLDAALANTQCVHWPNLAVLAMTHYAGKPRGPTVGAREDGTVCTRWWLGVEFHRDAKEGPANIEEKGSLRIEEYWVKGQLHRPPADGPAIVVTDDGNDGNCPLRVEEYWVEGQLHRLHQDGPAMFYTHYKKFDLSGEEYFEHGKWHRPSELGPAVTHWDRNGEPQMAIYYEDGVHHRDPSVGPAWWQIRDSRTDRTGERPCTEIRYCVRGQPHRDERDGPAWIKRDNETGVLTTEEYWRDGYLYREHGPAIIHRSPEGAVFYEAYWRGRNYRDASEGPGTIVYGEKGRVEAKEWFGKDGRHRNAAEGTGRISYLPNGWVQEEFYIDGEYRPAALGPASVTRDKAGNVVWEEFWDGKRMHRRASGQTKAEASAHR
jgi:hypothetical protein